MGSFVRVTAGILVLVCCFMAGASFAVGDIQNCTIFIVLAGINILTFKIKEK